MGAAEAPSSAGRQAAGGRSSQRRGRAALDGGSEAIRQGRKQVATRDLGRRHGASPACRPGRRRGADGRQRLGAGVGLERGLGHSGQRATPAG